MMMSLKGLGVIILGIAALGYEGYKAASAIEETSKFEKMFMFEGKQLYTVKHYYY